jgi:two-component system, OmpR family, sensor histidine kinase VanS
VSVHRTIRARLTLTYVGLLVGCTAAVLAVSWSVLAQHLGRTVPGPYADSVLGRLAAQYVVAVLGSALLALGIGWAASGHALAPVRAIARTAGRISEQRLDARVGFDASHPRDELVDLADAFDAMLDRLASTLDAQKRFVANASHELRTPLTVIRTEAEVALADGGTEPSELREALRGAVEGAERAEALLDGLLVLAAATRGSRRDEPVDLAGAAGRALGAHRLDVDLAPAVVRGDPALLERLIGNLVENAVRHGRAPRSLTVRAEGAEAVVRTVNRGDHLPADVLARLAEPFERGARTRAGGSGLGLSIVSAVAEAHGGALVLASPREGGLVAEVRLPALTAT